MKTITNVACFSIDVGPTVGWILTEERHDSTCKYCHWDEIPWDGLQWINTEGAVVALIIGWKSDYHTFLFTGDKGCWLESQRPVHLSCMEKSWDFILCFQCIFNFELITMLLVIQVVAPLQFPCDKAGLNELGWCSFPLQQKIPHLLSFLHKTGLTCAKCFPKITCNTT